MFGILSIYIILLVFRTKTNKNFCPRREWHLLDQRSTHLAKG